MKAHAAIPNAFSDHAGYFLFDSIGRLYEVRLVRKHFHAIPWHLNPSPKLIVAPTFTTLALLVAKH